MAESVKSSSITVAVRVRPFTERETAMLVEPQNDMVVFSDGSFSSQPPPPGWSKTRHKQLRNILNVVDDKMLIFDPPETNPLNMLQEKAFGRDGINSRIREHRFVFDQLFDQNCSQQQVFNATTRPLLDSILDGYNATVFAYGATGCGKTHTISGSPTDPGVIFLTMEELYRRIDELADTKMIEVSLSYLEIYNETIRDLLCPETDFKKLVLREDTNQKISVANLSAHCPANVQDVMDLILQGNKNRTTSPTDANATSSRSHAVLQINLVQQDRTVDFSQQQTFATLSIIDLAGSERAAATKNRGVRLNEGANINKSLLALGNCINALCDPRRRNHIPYRDSKLTRLLKFSLGGNCKTVMIVCVSPSSQHYDETLNTLKYADRAKEIKTKLIRNRHNLDRHVGSYLKMITEQKAQIEELKARELDQAIRVQDKMVVNTTQALEQVMEAITSLQRSVERQDKWKKYFILAKRKLLLLQKIDIDSLIVAILDSGTDVFSQQVLPLCEEILQKMETQVSDLELQYAARGEIDYLVEDSSQHMLKRLKERDGWCSKMETVFVEMVTQLKHAIERDILVNSSILFDHLIYKMYDFVYLPRSLITAINSPVVGDITYLLTQLEMMVGGEFDAALETYTAEFMQSRQPLRPPKRLGQDDDDDGSPKRTKLVPPEFEMDTSFDDTVITSDDLDIRFNPSLDSPPEKIPRRQSIDSGYLNKQASLKVARA